MHLTRLLTATCTANPYENDEDRIFSVTGQGKLGKQGGYEISFEVRRYYGAGKSR